MYSKTKKPKETRKLEPLFTEVQHCHIIHSLSLSKDLEEVDQLEPSAKAEGYDLAPDEDSIEEPKGSNKIQSSSCNNTLCVHPAEPWHINSHRCLSFQHTLGQLNSHKPFQSSSGFLLSIEPSLCVSRILDLYLVTACTSLALLSYLHSPTRNRRGRGERIVQGPSKKTAWLN